MSFIARFHEVLARDDGAALVSDVYGATALPAGARALRGLVASARAVVRGHGVAPGDRVVLIAANSTRWVATDLALLFEGAIVVPLYTRQAVPELAAMIRDCDPRLVIADSDKLMTELGQELSAPTPTSQPPRIVHLDSLFKSTEPTVLDRPQALAPPHPRAAGDVVTIIYTSGTSGEPKGVMLTVANVDFMLPIIADAIAAMLGGREDRVFHYLPLCFAGSRMVLWMCLFRGAGIALSTNLSDLVTEMKTARPTYYLNVPFLLERIRLGVEAKLAAKPAPIRALWNRGKRAYAETLAGRADVIDRAVLALARRVVFAKVKQQIGADLACLICGSAALPEDTQRWFEMLGIPVYQVYGLTETTAICTLDRPGQALAGRVGWAIPGCELRLGAEDELQIRGQNVFAGYWRRDEASRAALTEDGWFRTGDQAELALDGSLKLIGRVKNVLVPTSGHNVAPEPLEERLLRLPGVEQAVVFGHARPYLVAVVTGDVGPDALEAPLEALNADLPHYRRIRKLHVSKERLTPENGCLTANQKLRRQAIATHFADAISGLYA